MTINEIQVILTTMKNNVKAEIDKAQEAKEFSNVKEHLAYLNGRETVINYLLKIM